MVVVIVVVSLLDVHCQDRQFVGCALDVALAVLEDEQDDTVRDRGKEGLEDLQWGLLLLLLLVAVGDDRILLDLLAVVVIIEILLVTFEDLGGILSCAPFGSGRQSKQSGLRTSLLTMRSTSSLGSFLDSGMGTLALLTGQLGVALTMGAVARATSPCFGAFFLRGASAARGSSWVFCLNCPSRLLLLPTETAAAVVTVAIDVDFWVFFCVGCCVKTMIAKRKRNGDENNVSSEEK